MKQFLNIMKKRTNETDKNSFNELFKEAVLEQRLSS